ncbi:hypothetical protein EDF58_11619 [Novosphingobium sp. PhB57]|nr:hypothetical protein EDF58_11619 [Novosphingobium sp. PhB57]
MHGHKGRGLCLSSGPRSYWRSIHPAVHAIKATAVSRSHRLCLSSQIARKDAAICRKGLDPCAGHAPEIWPDFAQGQRSKRIEASFFPGVCIRARPDVRQFPAAPYSLRPGAGRPSVTSGHGQDPLCVFSRCRLPFYVRRTPGGQTRGARRLPSLVSPGFWSSGARVAARTLADRPAPRLPRSVLRPAGETQGHAVHRRQRPSARVSRSRHDLR